MTEPRMPTRRGEQFGWLLGWAGGFLWIIALALLFLWRGQWLVGLLGLALAGLGYAAVVFFRPWRSPRTRYWRLLLLPYVAMLGGVPWAIWGFGPDEAESLNAWQALIILPVLSPMFTLGWRRWIDGEAG